MKKYFQKYQILFEILNYKVPITLNPEYQIFLPIMYPYRANKQYLLPYSLPLTKIEWVFIYLETKYEMLFLYFGNVVLFNKVSVNKQWDQN